MNIRMIPAPTVANLHAICAEVQRVTGSPDSILGHISRPGDGVRYVFDQKVCLTIREAVNYAYGRLESTQTDQAYAAQQAGTGTVPGTFPAGWKHPLDGIDPTLPHGTFDRSPTYAADYDAEHERNSRA